MASKSTGNKSGGNKKTAARGGASRSGIEDVANRVVSEVGKSGLSDMLGMIENSRDRLRESLDGIDVKESIDRATEYLSGQMDKARDYTKKNPKAVAGGAAGVLVGASLLAYALNRMSGDEKKRAGSGSKTAKGGAAKSRSRKSGSKKSGSKSASSAPSGGSKKSPSSKRASKR